MRSGSTQGTQPIGVIPSARVVGTGQHTLSWDGQPRPKLQGHHLLEATVVKLSRSSLSGHESLETGFSSSSKEQAQESGNLEHRSNPQPSKEMLCLTQLLNLSPRMGKRRVTPGR